MLLLLTCEFLCHVQSTEILQQRLQEQRVWKRDILIEFRIMERFFFCYSSSSSLNNIGCQE